MGSPETVTTRSNGATRNGSAHRRKLPRLRGLDWIDSYRGDASTQAGTARVHVETDRWARVRLDLLGSRDASAALEDNALLPTNVRFSGSPKGRCLLADAWLGDRLSGRGIREAIDAIQLAAGTSSPMPIRRGGSKDRFADPIAWLGEDAGVGVAELDTGWELTQRVRGRRVAIRAEPEESGPSTLSIPSLFSGASARGSGHRGSRDPPQRAHATRTVRDLEAGARGGSTLQGQLHRPDQSDGVRLRHLRGGRPRPAARSHTHWRRTHSAPLRPHVRPTRRRVTP